MAHKPVLAERDRRNRKDRVCRCCGHYFRPAREPGRWDFAHGHENLCRDCWPLWKESAVFVSAASVPIPDPSALERWLASVPGNRLDLGVIHG